jgi:hypothetical protein
MREMSVRDVTLCCMVSELPYTLRNLARYQSGVVTRAQALEAGLPIGVIKFRVSSGRWQQLHLGVYATFTGGAGRGAQLWAAVLSAGPGALLSYETAAELQGLTDKPVQTIHVTIPGHRRVLPVQGITMHRSRRAGAAMELGSSPPRTRIEETVLDLAEVAANFDDVCGWVTRAFARELTDEAALRMAMDQRAKLRWRAELHELITAAASGNHSVLEYRYDRDVERAHGLPEPVRQAPFTSPDGGDAGIAFTPTTAWWWSWTGGSGTGQRISGGTRPVTTLPPRTGSSPCGIAGSTYGGTRARPRSRSPRC